MLSLYALKTVSAGRHRADRLTKIYLRYRILLKKAAGSFRLQYMESVMGKDKRWDPSLRGNRVLRAVNCPAVCVPEIQPVTDAGGMVFGFFAV